MKKTTDYRLVRNGSRAWLVSIFGTRYYFNQRRDEVTKEYDYILDTIPEFEEGDGLLYGKTVKEIVDNLNLSEVVVIKDWD